MALNPHQQKKVDISSLSEEEQKLFRLYGKLPNRKDLLSKKLQERKYFDSGDYAMSKAGKADSGSLSGGLGREHPTPGNIPHLTQQQSGSSPGEGGVSGGPRGSISGTPSLHPTLSNGQGPGLSGSPVKEASILHRGTSVDEQDPESVATAVKDAVAGTETDDAADEPQGVPIRQ
ncbi:hypothetical protein MRB53_038166 [Persea americana]|nr:hypothetical protein MRB53_038166 [Persea americana]